MEIFDRLAGHEQVVVCQDAESGLRAIIAVHSTALGPALGGTRFHPYRSDLEALDDVLRLSRAMTYKNAVAGLDLGGGKAVIIGAPRRDRSEPLLRAYGRFVASLGGRYVTACDVGTYVPDMDLVARETRWVTGRSTALGGSGDSSLLTAVGVMAGMRACAQHRWGSPTLEGRRVGVVGVGKVGHRLVAHLLADGARVVVTDSDTEAVARVRAAHPEVEVAGSAAEVAALPLDVYSPNALGGALDDRLVAALRAEVVCGGANNQLAQQGIGDALATRGVLYAPDFVVNAGGVIQVADELEGYDPERAQARAEGIFDTTLAVLRTADAEGVAPATAADRLAERRIAQVGRLRTIMLPR